MAEPLTGDDPQVVAGYQLRARLGAGGMGRVYLAFTPGGRPVALKMIRPEFGDDEEFRARFRHEVAAAQRVHGLFTAQVLDADPDAPQPWLATSYVPGMSLREAVSQHGPLPRGTVLLLIAGTAEALQAIHAVDIVHRDLKPANVILAADGPRVIDFGIARAAAGSALTLRGSVVGTPRFMAPEQARGETTTPAVDVFALGSLATYAITGHPPFGTDSPMAVLGRVLYDPPDLTGCPDDLRPLIERCLAKDPPARPQPSEVIATCRVAAGGELAFDRSWLPRVIAAATGTVPVPGAEGHDASSTEWTFGSQPGQPPALTGSGAPGPAALDGAGTDSGPSHPAGEATPGGPATGGTAPPWWSPARWSGGKAMAGVASVIAVLAVAAACVTLLSTPTVTTDGPPPGPQSHFAGTWAGTVHEPGLHSWAIKLTIPDSSSVGSFGAPALHCAGRFLVKTVTVRTMAGQAEATGARGAGCPQSAGVMLTRDSRRQLSLTWTPSGHPGDLGAATLTRVGG